MYLNGELDFEGNEEPGVIQEANEHVLIGGWSIHALAQWYNGTLDEVAIFNVALGEEEIQEIMNEGLTVAIGIGPSAVSSTGKLAATWAQIKAQ